MFIIQEQIKKLSQLDWRIKNAAIINGELNYDVLAWLSIKGRGWTTLAKNKAAMDDYDWFNPNQNHWTDWSHHENTHLNYANELDLSLRAWLLQDQSYKLGVAAGYQWNSFSWRSTGGCYQYNNGIDAGCFLAMLELDISKNLELLMLVSLETIPSIILNLMHFLNLVIGFQLAIMMSIMLAI